MNKMTMTKCTKKVSPKMFKFKRDLNLDMYKVKLSLDPTLLVIYKNSSINILLDNKGT